MTRTLPMIPLAIALALPLAAGADTLRLKEEVYVKGPTVTLGDVADIEGERADELATIKLSNAARPGDSKQVFAGLVESRLRDAGVDSEDFEIVGSRSVRATTIHLDVTRDEVAQSLRHYIVESMPWDERDTEIAVTTPNFDLTMPDGALAIDWRPSPHFTYAGSGSFTGTVNIDGEPQRTITVRADIQPYVAVVVAARDIPRGSMVGPADIELRKEALAQTSDGAMFDPADVLGMVAKKTIFPGQMLDRRYIEQRLLVRRNETVDVVVRAGSVQLHARAVAKMDGREGDLIVCVNPQSKEQMQGIVLPDGTVRVE
ncbi:MAG: flagellar basal body P-ring formation protein FlgA [Candidatus Hydrogenedens sp.]|nr:flagellar basal body P-ring formation protein FlgA [Candidatus Hydrogenedens sp.]